MQWLKNITARLYRGLASERCFWIIITFFALEAIWIALSGRYPMAFDEDFHLGIIRLYAHHISPFWSAQPPGAAMYGPIFRDPSYLYQYLLSFPYRLISAFTASLTVHVIGLRLINIAIWVGALVIYRKLLLALGGSKRAVHGLLLLFVLIPVVPLLAAQINYDSLFMLFIGMALLLTVRFNDELNRYKRFSTRYFLILAIVCLLGSLVKYAFLPFFAAIAAFVVVRLAQTFPSPRKLLLNVGFGLSLLTKRLRWILIVLVIISAGLFAQRYVSNFFGYHKPIPECDEVLTIDDCSQYGPWLRDYTLKHIKNEVHLHTTKNPIVFTQHWLYGMWFRMFFAVDGPATRYETRGPLYVPSVMIVVVGVATALVVIVTSPRWRSRYNQQLLFFILLTTCIYVGSLWLEEYKAFIKTGQPVAINGRYLFPVLLQVGLIGSFGWSELLQRRPSLRSGLLAIVAVSMLWGGGALTYVLRSNNAWYWQRDTVMTPANHAVKRILGPVTPGYKDPTAFLH